jgi:hypothetical protein
MNKDLRTKNDDIIDLITEAVWLDDISRATESYGELLREMDERCKEKRPEGYYQEIANACPNEWDDISEFSNLIVESLETGRWDKTKIDRRWKLARRCAELAPVVVEQEIVDCNIIKVTIEHNGIQGGDAGHGGFTRFTIKDEASTCMYVNGVESSKFTLEFRGDSERRTFIEALKVALETLSGHE